MDGLRCDVLIVGGGTGGCAAAMALHGSGLQVIVAEPTEWLGGQLTSQAVPPDEHPWIESFGCTATYREFRNRIRAWYRSNRPLKEEALADPSLNPGRGWVSRLCFEPRIGVHVLEAMLAPLGENLQVLLRVVPVAVDVEGSRIRSVAFENLDGGSRFEIEAAMVLDATELGDLLPLAAAEYRVGAESRRQTGEEHAVDGEPEPDNQQGITWCFAMAYDESRTDPVAAPSSYEFWKSFAPDFWAGPLLSWNTIHAHTGEPFTWTLFAHEHPRGMGLFDYRQIVSRKTAADPKACESTIVNWPQNDYYTKPTLDIPAGELAARCREAKELSLSLLYWLQNEAPRPDGGCGYPHLRLDPERSGTNDGFAMAPYIRESRRIEARFTVLERHVSAHDNPGKPLAEPFWDSVGVGSYRIDLHPSSNGRGTVDFETLPFQIPLGALVPVRMSNLLPAAKNLGVTHITNGCYRLHPVEWTIGEAAGALAAKCLREGKTPAQVYENRGSVEGFQQELTARGFQLQWDAARMGLER